MDQDAIKCSRLNINKTVYFVTKNLIWAIASHVADHFVW